MTDDLWAEASAGHDQMAREAAVALADAGLEQVMPFLLAARSGAEFTHRSELARDSIRSVALSSGVGEDELMATVRRRYELLREALLEGEDPLDEVTRASQGGGYGSGPERPDEHSEGPDFSGSYSEVPAGRPMGPDPSVTAPRPPMAGPVSEPTASFRRRADASPQGMMMPGYQQPPDTGTGRGSLDTAVPSSASAGLAPSLPAGVPKMADPVTPPGIGPVTSGRDPVRRRIAVVAAAIREVNPGLPAAECERVARQVVGRYLRAADLAGSVVNDDPVDSGSGSGDGSGSGGQDGGTGMAGHMLEWKGFKSMMPGAGGAAAGGGAAADLAGVAELAAL